MNYQPNLFRTIAKQVIAGEPEQYLYASASGLTAMFGSPHVEEAINSAVAALKDPCAVIRAEYQMLSLAQSCVFDDGATGLIDVDGVLVELSVRKLQGSSWRILFSRVDAAKLYTSLATRVSDLSKRVTVLESTAQ